MVNEAHTEFDLSVQSERLVSLRRGQNVRCDLRAWRKKTL